ncbi:MAG: hypothetical protein O2985_13465 [Proteobacteria bacterium]|nr:hypothetical protein [Pseudomonadota bacterium]
MRLMKTPAFMIWAGVSTLWIVIWLSIVISSWDSAMAGINALHIQRVNRCVSNYADMAARERCLILMDLEQFQARSVSIFNRALGIGGPPLFGLMVVLYLGRRSKSSPGRRR